MNADFRHVHELERTDKRQRVYPGLGNWGFNRYLLQRAGVLPRLLGGFEYGGDALLDSAQRLQAKSDQMEVIEQDLTLASGKEVVAYVLCTPDQQNSVLPQWQRWATSEHPQTAERILFFEGQQSGERSDRQPEVWWAFDPGTDLVWTTDLATAFALGNAIKQTAVEG